MRLIAKLIFILFFIPLYLFASKTDVNFLFSQGNKYFHEKKYDKAADFYKKIYKSGINNGYLFYNIGTCYLKEDKIGKSLFWYNKAKFFIPLNSSLNKNIQIAISKNQDNIVDKTFVKYFNGIFFLKNIFSIKANYYISTILFLILIFLLIFKILILNAKKKYFVNRAVIIIAILFIFFAGNFLFQYYQYQYSNVGYIIANNSYIRDDFNIDANTIATVNDGTKVFILSDNGNFYKIKLANNIEGWILKKDVIYKNNNL